jgi:hypothetical protein
MCKAVALLLVGLVVVQGYDIVQDHSGLTLYDGWDFYGSWDNLTLGKFLNQKQSCFNLILLSGDVVWLSEVDAFSQGLAYVNSAGNAVFKVDNQHGVIFNQKRNSVGVNNYKYVSTVIDLSIAL